MHEYRLAVLPGVGAADQKKSSKGLAELQMGRVQGLSEEQSKEASMRGGLQWRYGRCLRRANCSWRSPPAIGVIVEKLELRYRQISTARSQSQQQY
jgi:hypothetical protein